VTSPLERLAESLLAAEAPDAKEFAGLKSSGLARLKDAGNSSNSLPSRFDLAYNAAHALCLAALRYHGFRPEKRYIVFQVLPHTLGVCPSNHFRLPRMGRGLDNGSWPRLFDRMSLISCC